MSVPIFKSGTLEICVDSIASAIAAAKGGANRIELCSALSEAGLTPTPSFLEVVKASVDIPVFCMVRPRHSMRPYCPLEQEIIIKEVTALKNSGADGIVFGALTSDGAIDTKLCEKVINAANPLPCTFHRAFDCVSEPLTELENVISLGFSRILTSGYKPTAVEGMEAISVLVSRACGRINIMAGSGIRSNNCHKILATTNVTELHASARKELSLHETSNVVNDSPYYVTNEEEVHNMKQAITSFFS